MTDIILIGCGKAGSIHCKCYSKLKELNINIVALIDNNSKWLRRFHSLYKEFNDGESPLTASSLEEISREIDIENIIIDLCVPNDIHYQCAKEAIDLGVKKIIIEKPIANSVADAERIEKLDASIAITENYVYSKVTEQIREVIDKNNLKSKFVRTEFSKDRRSDSLNGRGFLKNAPPHVFTVEIPHQLAVVDYLFGNSIEIFGSWCEDMIIENKRFYEHGEGAIILHHKNGAISYNFSCLDGHKHLPIRHRNVMVYCEDGIKVNAHYPSGGDGALFGAVTMYENNHITEKYDIYDDTMTETLKTIILRFDRKEKQTTDAVFGRRIMELINDSIHLARIHG